MIALTRSHTFRMVALAMLVFPALLLQSDSVLALEFRMGEDIVIGAEEVIDDDLYLLGKTVTINGIVNGDVLANGLRVVLNGEVKGDLTGCGPTFIVDGTVGDDLRITGMEMKLGPDSRIADDVLAAGLRLQSDRGNVAGGGLLFAGYEAQLDGRVDEDIYIEAFNTDIKRPVIQTNQGGRVQPSWVRVRGLLAPLIVGLLLCWLAPNCLDRLQQVIGSTPIKTTAMGGLVLIAIVIIAALTMVFVAVAAGGAGYLGLWDFAALVAGLGMLTEGLLVALLLSVAIVLGPIAVGLALGRLMLNLRRRQPPTRAILPLVVGFAVLGILWSIPYVAIAASIIVLLLGLGALAVLSRESFRIAR